MSDILPVIEGLRILSLDGGGLNCVSELKILDEFMSRVQYESKMRLRPCQYFHAITGVGASGVIAILLGVLGLSIEETITRFLQLCNEVTLCEDLPPRVRSEKLLTATKVMLQELNVSEEARFHGNINRGEGCKVSIPYLSAVNMTHCRMLRSYDSKHSSYNPTILESISISWATPGVFAPVRVGAELMSEDLISAVDGFNNPTLQAIKETHEAFGQDQRVSCLLSIGAGRPPFRALSVDGRDLARKTTRDTEITAEQLKSRYINIGIYFRLSVDWNLSSGDAQEMLEERVGRIDAHTSTYLETQDASNTLERCVGASRRVGYITLEDLYRTRVKGPRSSRGLPPLSSFFLNRTRPMEEIVNVLKPGTHQGQRVAVVVGMGGSGKTQLSLKYAYDNDSQYDHVIFVDASSTESLQNGVLNRVRLLDRSLDLTTPDEAIQLLADPRGNISRHWLIILDNVDDAEIPLGDFFPPCDFGAILITTRNITLGNLSPDGVISLEVMSTEEAIELLLRTALGPSSRHTNRDREFAAEIVEMLGYLPMAIVQAGCYIKLQKCLPDYANRLRVNRARLLRKPALAQLDKLKYDHSVYAAFDTTLSVLSPLALKLLGILSFVHFTDFPYPLFGIAASYGFDYDPIYLFNRPEEYHRSVDLLKGAFCPNGAWDDEILERVLEELQQYSMLTLVPINSIVTLRLHPLIHSWAKDRLSAQEAVIFRAAAVQLLVCGTHFDNAYLWEYLFPHLKYFPPTSNELHLNDRAALAYIVRQLGTTTELVKIWENIHDQVRSSLGEGHLQTSRATLQLADAYGENNELEKMEQLEREVVELRSSLFGAQHPETLLAMGNLARTLKSTNKYTDASQLEMFVISNSRTAAKPDPRGLAIALNELALTRRAQKQYAEAIVLVEESVDIMKALLGEAHTATISTMELLSSCYALAGEQDHVRDLRTQMEGLKRQLNGPRYMVLLRHMDSFAYACFKEEKYAEAESQWKEVLAGHQETSGNMHTRTLSIMLWLSSAIHHQGKHAEADELVGKVVEGRRLVYGETHVQTLDALHLQAKFLHVQGRYAESEKIWSEELVGRRKVDKTNSDSTLNALGCLSVALFEQKKYQEAETLRRELYAGYRKAVGEHHVMTLKALLQLARAIFEQGRYMESVELFQRAVEGRRKVHGNSHASTLGPIHWVGRSLYAQSNFSEAEKVWREELKGRREVYGNRHPPTANVLGWLSNALFEQKQYAEAEGLRREEWECRREMQGELDADTLSALAGLAHVILMQARHAEGHALLRDLVEKQKAARGDDHPETQRAIQWLHEATTSAEQEKVVDDAGTYHAPMPILAASLPLASMPQPQRSFAWFQRFQQSGNTHESLTSPAPPINEALDVDP